MLFAATAVLPALLTPFDDRDGVDHEALRAHVEFLVEAGVHGLMPAGTTGETALLEPDETIAVVASTIEAAAGRVKVVAHVGRPSTRATAHLIERAIDAGADAVAAILPYYYPVGDDQIVAHFEALIATAKDTPVFAYNFPARTGNDLSAATLARLAGAGLAGLKDSTGSAERHAEYLAAAPGIEIFVGNPTLLIGSLRGGSQGTVAALANLAPEVLVEVTTACAEGRVQDAERLAPEIDRLVAEISSGPMLVALKRLVADRLGERGVRYPTALRSPLGP